MRLVRAEIPLLDAALAGDDALAGALGCAVVPGWATFAEALAPTRDGLLGVPDGAAWGPRLFVAGDPPELVGWGGFKGPPRDGTVELGYEIAASRRRRGLATAAVQAMLAEAFAAADVTRVIAHTLAHRNASNRLLERLGFTFDGEVAAGDEVTWRFALARPTGAGPQPPTVQRDGSGNATSP
jgi:RimJ/RimL family protein N-acetyltransferase